MNPRLKISKIDSNIRILLQLQDLSTIQTTLLGIIFGLFIFSITAIITRYNDLVYVISFIMLFIETIALLFLLSSIFTSNFQSKLDFFLIFLHNLILIIVYFSISGLYLGLSLIMTSTFFVNNFSVVLLILIPISLGILINNKVEKKLKNRFSLLYNKEKIRLIDNELLKLTDRIYYRFISRISFSFLIAIIVTIVSGFVEITNQHYGFPFPWFMLNVDGKPFLTDSLGLYLDFIVYTILMYLILIIIKYVKNKK